MNLRLENSNFRGAGRCLVSLKHRNQLAVQRLLGESKWRIQVCLISIYQFVLCQVETSESLEGIFAGGLINCGNSLLRRLDSLEIVARKQQL